MATKKTHTIDEVDKLTLSSEKRGFLFGMATCYTTLTDEVDKFARSIDDVWAMYYSGDLADDHKLAVIADMKAISLALTQLKDVMEGAYFDALDMDKKIDEADFARAWREDIASSKEEWPL